MQLRKCGVGVPVPLILIAYYKFILLKNNEVGHFTCMVYFQGTDTRQQKARLHICESMGKNNTISNKLTTVLFIIYLIALFWILLFKLGVRFSYMGKRSVNLIPFNEFLISKGRVDVGEIILNVVIFVPLGIYSGILFKKWTWRNKLFFFLLSSLMFEGLQFIFEIGAFDITDIITNTLGGIIGLLIFEAIEKLFNNSVKSQKFINIIAATGTVIMISLLLLLKLNMLPIRYQ